MKTKSAQSLAVLRNAAGQPARKENRKGRLPCIPPALLPHAHARVSLHDGRSNARACRFPVPGSRQASPRIPGLVRAPTLASRSRATPHRPSSVGLAGGRVRQALRCVSASGLGRAGRSWIAGAARGGADAVLQAVAPAGTLAFARSAFAATAVTPLALPLTAPVLLPSFPLFAVAAAPYPVQATATATEADGWRRDRFAVRWPRSAVFLRRLRLRLPRLMGDCGAAFPPVTPSSAPSPPRAGCSSGAASSCPCGP